MVGVLLVSLTANYCQYQEIKSLTNKVNVCYNELWTTTVQLGARTYQLNKVADDYNTLKGGLDKIESMVLEATAYTHTGNPTRTGVMPSRGMVAVDPKVIPLGSKVYVEGYGWATATDTGGDIQGNRIDLFMETEAECWEFGRKNLKIVVDTR